MSSYSFSGLSKESSTQTLEIFGYISKAIQ
jgi:hypothetical protein